MRIGFTLVACGLPLALAQAQSAPRDLRMRPPRPFPWSAQWRLLDPAPFSARVAPDGRVGFDDHAVTDASAGVEQALPPSAFGPFDPVGGAIDRAGQTIEVPLFTVGFRFDLTDLAMRRRGEDPYRVEKQQLLARTFDVRWAMATEARRRLLWRALRELPDELAFLWSDPSHSSRRKRAAIAKLWCEADSEERGTDILPAGQEARAIIEQFVRTRLPLSSHDHFTVEELEAAHAQCPAAFAPYRIDSP